MTTAEFTAMTDLASRALGGSVAAASDELFAQRENLIRAEKPFFNPAEFGHKGKVYDGWETRRRRSAVPDPDARDYAIVRLGAAGIVHGLVVDTAYFKGNYPPFISVEAASIEGYPDIDEVLKADWVTIVEKSPADGDTANTYAVADRHRWTHVRLSIYPDGGVARLRVHGEVLPDPRFLSGTVDLLAAETGAWWAALTPSTPRRPTSSCPGAPATWARAGRTPAAAAPATTTQSSRWPPRECPATPRSTPATTWATRRDGSG